MANLLNEQEFTERFTEAITERFTEAIREYQLSPSCKELLVLELHYGADEPVLTLSLKEAFARYQVNPDELNELLNPYVQDIGWTLHDPRYPAKEVYENSLPTMRNFYLSPPIEEELADNAKSPKGPIVYDEVLKAPTELLVMQFNIFKRDTYIPLRKGDTLRCIPDIGLLAKLSLHNLALLTESAGITATPLQFESLKAQSWLVGLGDEKYKQSISALSCIPPLMSSLEETFRARDGLIAIMPATDQLIISTDTNDESICELGVLAQQLLRRAPNPLSCLIWSYRDGNLEAVQSLDLDEAESNEGNI